MFLLPKLILSLSPSLKIVLNVPKYYYHARYHEEVFKSNTSFYIKVKKKFNNKLLHFFLVVNVGVSIGTDSLVDEVRKLTASASFFNLVPTPLIHCEQGTTTPTKIGFA